MDGVATPIIGRPRPLPGHDTPNPAYHPHTLNYEEPHYCDRNTHLGLRSAISSKAHSMVNLLLVYGTYMGTDRYDVA